MKRTMQTRAVFASLAAILLSAMGPAARAQTGPTVNDPNLDIRTVATGLTQPTTMAFLGEGDLLVLEKATGRVQRVTNGVVQSTVLDLAVNSGSERGLLGIALHPDFAANGWVYLFWTQSATGADTANLADLGSIWFSLDALLANRVDRFVWNGSTLVFDRNVVRIRAYQADPGQPLRGNHDGGILKFGPDNKLYVIIGDLGRRGQMQNLPSGPTLTGLGPIIPDDPFGGPAPDNAHLSGVVLRLNDDGTAPTDNPFFAAGATQGGEVGANLQKLFAYGFRNGFGMGFDPVSGALWTQENSDDAFCELNLVEPGFNLGWVQIMGPVERLAQYKQIETTQFGGALQQIRWPPTRIADTPQEALSRLFLLPGARYSDPEFSWKYAVSPAGLGFLSSAALGPDYENDLFLGASTPQLAGGYLFRFDLSANRQEIASSDSRLADKVVDNLAKYDATENESLLFGSNFGTGTDIQTGPNGNLYVVSLSRGAIYEIFRRPSAPRIRDRHSGTTPF